MSRAVGLGVVVAVLLGLAAPGSAATGARRLTGDWLLVTADGGEYGTSAGDFSASGTVALAGSGPFVIGLGDSWNSRQRGVAVFTGISSGPVELRSSADAGAARLTAFSAGDSAYSVRMSGYIPALGAHQRSYLLYFVTNARFVLTSFGATSGGRVSYHTGRGSRALRYVDSDDRGLGVAAGTAAAGAVTRVEDVKAGLVGAVAYAPMLFTGLPTTGSWSGPGGLHGSWTSAAVLADTAQFAGPRGRWSWSWTGAAQGGGQAPVIAAYAPLGATWSAFVPAPVG